MTMQDPVLITGNEAAAEAALRAGMHFYAGYPITPQNELTAYMADQCEPRGRVFVQSESELAAVNMVFGAAATGARAMTSSSSPGISLKQEGISYMAGARLPGLIINVMRGGPGLGNISGSQSDYYQATRGGGHGDYHTLVLAPWSAQEIADMVGDAFLLSERYRIPAMLLFDGYLGQTMEPVCFADPVEPPSLDRFDWSVKGASGRDGQRIVSLLMGDGELEERNRQLQETYRQIESECVRFEWFGAENPEVLAVAFGLSARQTAEAVESLHDEGQRVALLRPQTLWPFPTVAIQDALARSAGGLRSLLVVEMNCGQMVDDVRLAVEGRASVGFLGRSGGGVPDVESIRGRLLEMLRAE